LGIGKEGHLSESGDQEAVVAHFGKWGSWGCIGTSRKQESSGHSAPPGVGTGGCRGTSGEQNQRHVVAPFGKLEAEGRKMRVDWQSPHRKTSRPMFMYLYFFTDSYLIWNYYWRTEKLKATKGE